MFSQLNIACKEADCLELYEVTLLKQTAWHIDQQTQKGIIKELSTSLSWGKEQIIGYKSEEKDFSKNVTKIWRKVCAKHKVEILTFSTRTNFMVTGPLRATILGILGRLQKMK